MDLTAISGLLRRWWLLLAVAALVAGLAGYGYADGRTEVFETETALLVGPFNADTDTLRASGQLAQTYAELATRADLLQQAIERVAPQVDVDTVSVDAVANEVTRVLTVRVRAEDPVVAKGVAAALADDLVALAEVPVPVSPDDVPAGEPTPPAQVRPEGRMEIVLAAQLPEGPVSPQAGLTAVLAGLAGLLAALGPVLLYEHRSQIVHTPADVPLPAGGLLGVLGGRRPRGRGTLAERLVVDAMPRSGTAQSFRVAATDVEAAVRHLDGVRSIVVTGTDVGDGSGDVAANLAGALVHSGLAVTLVDQDADVAEITALADHPREPVTFALRHGPGLTVVPYGELLPERDADAARAWIGGQLEASDAVVIHAPAVRGSAMTLLWATAADAAIVVARRGSVHRADVEESVDRLRRVQAEVLGVLFDGRPGRWRRARRAGVARAPRSARAASAEVPEDGPSLPARRAP